MLTLKIGIICLSNNKQPESNLFPSSTAPMSPIPSPPQHTHKSSLLQRWYAYVFLIEVTNQK